MFLGLLLQIFLKKLNIMKVLLHSRPGKLLKIKLVDYHPKNNGPVFSPGKKGVGLWSVSKTVNAIASAVENGEAFSAVTIPEFDDVIFAAGDQSLVVLKKQSGRNGLIMGFDRFEAASGFVFPYFQVPVGASGNKTLAISRICQGDNRHGMGLNDSRAFFAV